MALAAQWTRVSLARLDDAGSLVSNAWGEPGFSHFISECLCRAVGLSIKHHRLVQDRERLELARLQPLAETGAVPGVSDESDERLLVFEPAVGNVRERRRGSMDQGNG